MRLAFPTDLIRRCWFLAGPTASGKTAVSLALAEALGAELVAMDSMSLYRGMDIGTAKPDGPARVRVPHHLLDVIEPHEEYSLAEYVQSAQAACVEIVSRGRTPLFVGGTGLYLRSILRGLFQGPPADWELRRRLAAEAEHEGPSRLHAQLAQIDPPTAARLHPNDVRRIVRGIEVYMATGRPLSAWQQERPLPVAQRTPHVYWLCPERDWLHERILRRVSQMIAEGLPEEVRRLAAGPPLSRTARQAVGYKELLDHFEGQGTFEHAVRLIEDHTRQFAKRQFTWFRNLEECIPIPIQDEADLASVAGRMLASRVP